MTSAHLSFDTTGHRIAQRVTGMRPSAVRDLFAAAVRPDIISLSGGMPDVSLLPKKYVRQAVEYALGEESTVALQYGGTTGLVSLAETLCDVMQPLGIRAKAENIIITSGAQEALELISKAFIDPGDIILCEGPTYLGALQAFSAYEPEVRCVAFDDNGLRMDLLEEELERIGKGNPKLKFLYTIPNFQNPGGVTMSSARRKRLLELAEEYDFIIVEDDPYGRLRYEGGSLLPLKALDDRVVYLGTISKVFAPGLRTGWICAPVDFLARINLVKQGTDLCGSTFDQVVVNHYFKDTPWERTLQGFIRVYAERRDALLSAMERHFPKEATWTHPEGGLFVWATLPSYVDTSSMLSTALEKGVTYVPGNSFFPDGKTGINSMRLNFSFETAKNLEIAVERLAEVIEERLEMYRVFIEAGALRLEE